MKHVIIDVRTPAEYALGHVENSLNIDIFSPQFLVEIQKLDKNQNYHLYCRTGNRSGQAETTMKQLGFKDVKNIGGLDQAAEMYSFVDGDSKS